MIQTIERTSEEILSLIHERNCPVNIREVESRLKSDREFAYMGISWLIQEGQVHVITEGAEKYICDC